MNSEMILDNTNDGDHVMIGHCLLVALGTTYLVNFSGHWLKLQAKPVALSTRPLHFDSWCHLGLGAFYTCAGVMGA